ncbi:hypothetical protein [Streptomyces montanisoli]|uniref:Uncharacterized protein n=1 Tax=Streptomyces montanisoli TaxID=2798581 RepID=A0A940RWD3_9ACTN|nr:hypothetical protein [Streptomyces montanisoli]MBP0456489.1 hypothetical protein [Streptomyces montanisoli]
MTTAFSADATNIIEQLRADQAAGTAAGLGSPDWDAFHDLLVELVAEAPDPKSRIREIADLIEGHAHTREATA